MRFNGLTASPQIRVYYLTGENKLCEKAYSASRGWYDGDLNHSNIIVAPYSKIAACFLAVGPALVLRVYVQDLENKIQEYGYDSKYLCHNLFTAPLILSPKMARQDGRR